MPWIGCQPCNPATGIASRPGSGCQGNQDMFESVEVHEYLTKVEVPPPPPMPIREGGCSYSHGNVPRIMEHYNAILATVLDEPDGLARIRKLFYLMVEARNQWPLCGWRIKVLLPHIMAIPATDAILTYLARFAATDLPGSTRAFVALKEYISSDIPAFHCPGCESPQATHFTIARHTCPGCHADIPDEHFSQSQWHKCACGKMIHVSDSGFVCAACGEPFSSKGLQRHKQYFRKQVIRERLRQTLELAGLPETALDWAIPFLKDPKRLEWLANVRI